MNEGVRVRDLPVYNRESDGEPTLPVSTAGGSRAFHLSRLYADIPLTNSPPEPIRESDKAEAAFLAGIPGGPPALLRASDLNAFAPALSSAHRYIEVLTFKEDLVIAPGALVFAQDSVSRPNPSSLLVRFARPDISGYHQGGVCSGSLYFFRTDYSPVDYEGPLLRVGFVAQDGRDEAFVEALNAVNTIFGYDSDHCLYQFEFTLDDALARSITDTTPIAIRVATKGEALPPFFCKIVVKFGD